MSFPSGTSITTDNVASGSADPSLARVDLYNLIVAVNALIASENGNSGVAVLNSTGKLPARLIPSTMAPTGDLTLIPTSGVVSLSNVLRLAQLYTVEVGTVVGTSGSTAGDLIYLVDGDAGQPCLGCYDGSAWRIVRFGSTIGDVGGTLESAFSLEATPDA